MTVPVPRRGPWAGPRAPKAGRPADWPGGDFVFLEFHSVGGKPSSELIFFPGGRFWISREINPPVITLHSIEVGSLEVGLAKSRSARPGRPGRHNQVWPASLEVGVAKSRSPQLVTNRTLVRAFGDPTDDFPMKKALRNCSWRPFGLKALLLTSSGQNDPQTVPRDVEFLVTIFW